MENKLTTQISFFASLNAKVNSTYTLQKIIELIKNETYKKEILAIRNESDKSKQNELKKQLPAVTISGLFSNQHKNENLVSHSGLIQIDIDDLEKNRLWKLREKFKTDKYTLACFLSPSGNGLKLIFKIPASIETHLQSFLAIEKYFLDVYKQQIDKSCKDVSRLMFISSDANIYSNFESEIFTDFYSNIKPITKNPNQKKQISNDVCTDIENCIIQIEQRQIDITNNYEDWLKIGFALSDATGENGRGFYHRISRQSTKYKSSECDIQYSKCTNGKSNGISKGTFFKICQDYGIDTISPKDNTSMIFENLTNNKVKPISKFVQVKNLLNDNFDFRFNIISNEIEYKDKNSSNYIPCNENNIYSFLEHNNCAISVTKLTILLRSDFVIEYNPFVDYFMNLTEYNQLLEIDYITKLCDYLFAIDKERFFIQFKKMFVRSVACALDDSIFNKQAFILVHSKQNSGKSTFCRWLCPPKLDNYITENLNTDKDSLIALSENFIINLDELATLSKTEINTLKSFFSKDKIKVRRPYEKKPISVPRRTNFVGSTNNQEFLTDYTGSVRWLCFEIEKIDWNYKNDINIDDIWRQAYYLYKQGFKYELTFEEVEQNEKANSAFTIHTPEVELITKHFEEANETNSIGCFYTATDVLTYLQNKYGQNIRLNTQNIGKALKYIGIEKSKKYRNGTQIYGYILYELPKVDN